MDHETIDNLAEYLLPLLTAQSAAAAQGTAGSIQPTYEEVPFKPSTTTSTVDSQQNLCHVLQTERKMRVLCLHGFAADAGIMSQLLELQGWSSRLNGIDFVIPDALHQTNALPDFEPYRPLTESGVYDKHHYKWWATFSISKHIAKHAEQFTTKQGEKSAALSPEQWPEQWNQTTEYLKEVIDRFGPCARFKFVMSVVGPPPDLDFTSPMKSLHLLGRDDTIFDKDELLPQIKQQFPNGEAVLFSGGHTVPAMTADLMSKIDGFVT